MNDILKEKVAKLGELYKVLEVPVLSDFAVFRESYKLLAKKYHPDKNKDPGAAELFMAVNEAFNILKTSEDKAQYDAHIRANQQQQLRRQAMTQQRRRMEEDLIRREQEAARDREKHKEQAVKRNKAREEREKEEQQRLKFKQQLMREMEPKQYYATLNSINVKWEKNLAFNPKLLAMGFQKYGPIKEVSNFQDTSATIQYHTIQAAEKAIAGFKHPKIRISFVVSEQRRKELLKAISSNRKEKLDFSLSTDNLQRLRQLINRSSNQYVQENSKPTATYGTVDYDRILREEGLL